jgi:hypothetical protein
MQEYLTLNTSKQAHWWHLQYRDTCLRDEDMAALKDSLIVSLPCYRLRNGWAYHFGTRRSLVSIRFRIL